MEIAVYNDVAEKFLACGAGGYSWKIKNDKKLNQAFRLTDLFREWIRPCDIIRHISFRMDIIGKWQIGATKTEKDWGHFIDRTFKVL